MITSIQLKTDTKKRLEKLRKKYETRFNRKLSYDEVIDFLVERIEESFNRKNKAANNLFGILKESDDSLVKLRKEGEKRLEVIFSDSGKTSSH